MKTVGMNSIAIINGYRQLNFSFENAPIIVDNIKVDIISPKSTINIPLKEGFGNYSLELRNENFKMQTLWQYCICIKGQWSTTYVLWRSDERT